MPSAISIPGIAVYLFWGAVAVLFYVYVGYPLLLAAIGPLFRNRKPEPDYFPMLSVLIAAYNEEASIGKKIEQTLALDYPADKLEILVLSDGSMDRTDEIVKSFQDPRVRLLRMEPRKGKTSAQNRAVPQAKGEVLVFSDATTVYHPMALRYLASNYRNPIVGAASGRYQYFDAEGGSPTGLGTIAFWNYENLIKTMQSRIRTISGCCGCIYSIRKCAYTPLPEDVISDLVQPLWVLQQGYRVVFEDRALAFEETTQSAGEEFSMRVRVVTRGIRGILSVKDVLKPWKFPWVSIQLISHKILRWMVPFFLLILFASSVALTYQPFYAVILALQLLFYASAFLSIAVPLHRRWKPLGIPMYFCLLNAAAFCSVIEVIRGRKYVTWETVRS
jgi:cellulose synthase/poly-beta-1,6-N-acetylglucosamine synthase-like glycosyltransferase